MNDYYGPGLNSARVYTNYVRGKLAETDDIESQINDLDPNKAEDLKVISELHNRISMHRIAIDFANDVMSLILKLTQPPN
jgi:hypothetical protein